MLDLELKNGLSGQAWCPTSLIHRLGQELLCEFAAGLGYIVSSSTSKSKERGSVSSKQSKQNKNQLLLTVESQRISEWMVFIASLHSSSSNLETRVGKRGTLAQESFASEL